MHPNPVLSFAVAVVALGASFPKSMARPDEGMWPFDNLPLKVLKEKYNFEPTQEWLDHVRLGSVRFDTGGSGSFVSANGLVMTNHHVALTTIQAVSTPEKDWVEPGFSARLYGKEVPCNVQREGESADDFEERKLKLRQLADIKDVTKQVLEWKAADKSEAGNEWRAKVEELCSQTVAGKPNHKADLVTLYDGNQFRLHVYRVFEDIRLVFAPEKQVAFFGGDLDNFTYPRYCLDCAFFRVYEDGKPIDSSKFHFQWDGEGAKTDELVFVSGHPGGTERTLTYAELEFHRDYRKRQMVDGYRQMAATLKSQMEKDEKAKFDLRDQYFGVTNALKALEGHLGGLRDTAQMAKMKAREEDFIARAKPEVKEAFASIEKAYADYREAIEAKKPQLELQAMRQKIDREIAAPAKAVINQALFDVYRTDRYPDATFTLRLSFGTVKGYEAGTTLVPPKTTINGLFERNAAFDNAHPFDLPKQWVDKKSKLKLDTPFNFVCTADIIGGNSGSPILDRDAKVVGLVFDGNIESLPSHYWYDERVNRCVGVHTAVMTEALSVIYEEHELVKELTGGK